MGNLLTSAEIGSLIRSLRQDAGLSQERLAELVGVSFQQMQRYETGQTTLNVIKLQKVAEALKVPVSYFFEDSSRKGLLLDAQENELIQVLRKVKNLEMRDCIIKLANNLNKKSR